MTFKEEMGDRSNNTDSANNMDHTNIIYLTMYMVKDNIAKKIDADDQSINYYFFSSKKLS